VALLILDGCVARSWRRFQLPHQQNQARCENRCQKSTTNARNAKTSAPCIDELYAVLSERKGVSRTNGCRCRTLSKLAPEPDWSKMEDRITAVEIALNQRLHDLSREGFGVPTELHAMAETRQRLESLQADVARSMKSTIRTNRAALVAPRLTD
jgi:hypothetical protein